MIRNSVEQLDSESATVTFQLSAKKTAAFLKDMSGLQLAGVLKKRLSSEKALSPKRLKVKPAALDQARIVLPGQRQIRTRA